ncbi:hypothetical protein RND61_15090 [Streptomyces sp. TRM76323]|uniref:Uncharacterized protein n=1 Tax=Streptomyces tamarix TaxID=3078565 RepID=A0ABU3QLS5_9ACTN|nr:hypothetical protein [Streptomyces tamarix]MDT9683389.1 hypothetical protein [Streptomyces tamarix]
MQEDNQEQKVEQSQGTQVDASLVISNLAQDVAEKTVQIATLKARISELESKVK